ncbi:hypothetical protein [Streptomyces mayteni]
MGISASWIRVLRAAVFAALCVTLATGAHVLLSGAPLPLPTVAVVAAAVFAVALLLAGDRERGFWPIAGLLVPLHLAADTLFTTGQATCYGPSGGPITGPLRLLGLDLVCAGGDLGAPLARLTAGGEGPLTASPWLLLAAQVAVGLLAADWLAGGEAALARLARAAVAATFRPLLLAVAAVVLWRPARRPLPRSFRTDRAAPALPVLAHSVLRRGPPAAPRYAPV